MGTDLGMAAHERPGECLIELLDVESLEVQVLVDNVTDLLSINPDTVRSELACSLQAGMFKWRGSSRGFQLRTGRIVPFRDIPQPDALTAKGGSAMYTSGTRLLLDRYFAFSGEISRVTTYEQGFPNHVSKRSGKWEPDP